MSIDRKFEEVGFELLGNDRSGGCVHETKECRVCGGKYKQIGQHWRWNPDHRPNFSEKQMEVLAGIFMGDGTINRGNKNPRFEVGQITFNYLLYLDYLFGSLSNGVVMSRTAEEGVRQNRDRDFIETINEDEYHDFYKWSTPSHPDLEKFEKWYSGGKKEIPTSVDLTPTTLKHWYVSDGHLTENNAFSLAMNDQIDNRDVVEGLFTDVGFAEPKWKIYDRSDEFVDCEAVWSVSESEKIFDYIGKPLPSFTYKWPGDSGAVGGTEYLVWIFERLVESGHWSRVAQELDEDLSDVGETNIAKLLDRQERDVLVKKKSVPTVTNFDTTVSSGMACARSVMLSPTRTAKSTSLISTTLDASWQMFTLTKQVKRCGN